MRKQHGNQVGLQILRHIGLCKQSCIPYATACGDKMGTQQLCGNCVVRGAGVDLCPEVILGDYFKIKATYFHRFLTVNTCVGSNG